ncbi:MAG TPA: hypothetical protein VFN23_10055 [Ktedonobacteraceae bacterium]|nr:hypothetical protein [Ktedonobacteraceae bacterium]
MKNRAVWYVSLLMIPICWAGFVVFTRFIPPEGIAAFLAFFVILDIALTSTLVPVAYAINSRVLPARLFNIAIQLSLRQGALLALCIVLNLILRALHSWNIFTGVVIVGAAVIIEILSLARK